MEDIRSAFALLGSSHSRDDILLGNTVLAIAGFAERLVAWFLYFPVKLVMPWGGTNYYDYPFGGLFNGGEISAAYYESVWSALTAPDSSVLQSPLEPAGWDRDTLLAASREGEEGRSFLYAFARRCIQEGVVQMDVTDLEDGSVRLGPPRITNPKRFVHLLLK